MLRLLRSRCALALAAVALSPALGGCAVDADPAVEADTAELQAGVTPQCSHGQDGPDLDEVDEVDARGAFTCDFRLAGDMDPAGIAPLIERDRMLMSEGQHGLVHKQIPLSIDMEHFTNGAPDFDGGGRYLYHTYGEARAYHHYVDHLVMDGVKFLERPFFRDPECYDFHVLHAVEFAPVTSQVVLRTERFVLPRHGRKILEAKWPAIYEEALSRNLASVWVLYNEHDHLASLVYSIDRVGPKDPNVPDFASLAALRDAPALGHVLDEAGWERTFDATHWVLTVWYPFVKGDHGKASDWPHSPPLPEPYCTDGVCEPSRGESNATCAADCPTHCGDAVCQPNEGEDTHNCPGDCGL